MPGTREASADGTKQNKNHCPHATCSGRIWFTHRLEYKSGEIRDGIKILAQGANIKMEVCTLVYLNIDPNQHLLHAHYKTSTMVGAGYRRVLDNITQALSS